MRKKPSKPKTPIIPKAVSAAHRRVLDSVVGIGFGAETLRIGAQPGQYRPKNMMATAKTLRSACRATARLLSALIEEIER